MRVSTREAICGCLVRPVVVLAAISLVDGLLCFEPEALIFCFLIRCSRRIGALRRDGMDA